MIITQTPIRISLAGGGTDFPEFFRREEGCVLSSAIDKYVFVIIKARFDDKIRVGYSRTEMVDHVDEVQHELVREALRLTGIHRGVEIATMADIPAQGSGLGSSSAVTVGLLNAMYVYTRRMQTAETLAREACRIEIEILGKPIGIQDQYIAAYGGLRFLRFHTDGSVTAEELDLDPGVKRRLNQNLMLFWTGIQRNASDILAEQKAQMDDHMPYLREVKALALEARACLLAGEIDELGRILHRNWELKKRFASKITNPQIDDMYATALRAGALGGKIAGAGGGGFLLLYCPRERQADVRAALHGFRELPFHLESDGTKVIFN
ncbi:MAG: GHMP family kinase ATP-binding protein, partial [Anaerolineae bacterium]